MKSKNHPRRARLIVNPIAGQGRAYRQIGRIVPMLEQAGLSIDLVTTERRGDARDAAHTAVDRDFDRIIVAGGDGTINEVINALAGTDLPMAVIPVGTGNVFAQDARIPLSIPKACALASNGNRRRLDLGRGNGLYFLLMAGIGFDAHVVRQVPAELKARLKDYAYLVTTLRHFFRWKAARFQVEFDGHPAVRRRAWLAMVGNAASYAWNIKVTSLALMDDGLLDFCLFPGRSKLAHMRQVVRTLLGQHLTNGEVEYHKVRTLKIETDPPVPVQLDGDSVTSTPIKIEVVPGAINVVVPENNHRTKRVT